MDIKRYNGKIYSIRSHQTDLIYIGSTTETRLSARLSKHKAQYNFYNNNKGHYYTSYEILKFDDAYIELLEEVENVTKNELQRLEGEHIRQNKCVNKFIAGQTRKEHYINNKDKYSEKHKEYYKANKDKINTKSNQIYICSCNKSLSIGNKARHDKKCKANVKC